MPRLRITQVRSAGGRKQVQGRTLAALGLHRLQQTVEHEDTPQIRGMIAKIGHLLRIEEAQA